MLVKGRSRSVDGMESYWDTSALQTTVTFLAILKLNITQGLVVVVIGYWLINKVVVNFVYWEKARKLGETGLKHAN